MYLKKLIYLCISGFSLVACSVQTERISLPPNTKPTVFLQKTERGFQLFRNDEPYFIKGAGSYTYYSELKARGGNSIRVWETNDAERILDEAHRLGLTVMLGLWIGREQDGFNYYNPQAVEKQLQTFRKIVLQYKDHPALLLWCIGNEWMEEATNPEVFAAVNNMARMIHEVDPNHPTTTALMLNTTTRRFKIFTERCPEIDILSINTYGSLPQVAPMLTEIGWQKPYIISEFGPLGYWESTPTGWNAPVEHTSSQKAEFVKTNYTQYISQDSGNCLGSYVFLWGQKQERTPTWFSMFDAEGNTTAVVDVMQYLWTGQMPVNEAPYISQLVIDQQYGDINRFSTADSLHTATVTASDSNGDSLQYQWELLPEVTHNKDGAVYRERKPDPLTHLIKNPTEKEVTFRLPAQPGPYRLFAYVYDGHQHVATANIPFLVEQ